MKKPLFFCALATALYVQGAPAQEPQLLAQAAGYRAMFTCSATFNGGKQPAMIKAHELSNISEDFQAAIAATGEPIIDAEARTVSVLYDPAMPPRIAAWRAHLGCTALPQGANPDLIEQLPRIKLPAPRKDPAALPWPQGDMLSDKPLPESISAPALKAALQRAFLGDFGGVTSAALVVQNGRLLQEQYLPGYTIHTAQRTWSVAKSIAASVIGAAVHKRIISIEEPAGLAAWQRTGDPRQAITVAHLLNMSSGLDSRPAGNRTDNVYFGGGLVAQYATRNPLNAIPGSHWRYANNDTLLLMRTLRERLNNQRRYLQFPFKALLHPIGMHHTTPETDWDGDFVLSSQVWTTSRDLARLGLLYLNDGVWQNERILPAGWSRYVATPSPAQPPDRTAERASEPGHGYGAQFWLYQNYPGVPAGTYAALGNRGQFVIIVPAHDAVIVRRGYDYAGNRFDGPAFTAAVLQALAEPNAP